MYFLTVIYLEEDRLVSLFLCALKTLLGFGVEIDQQRLVKFSKVFFRFFCSRYWVGTVKLAFLEERCRKTNPNALFASVFPMSLISSTNKRLYT